MSKRILLGGWLLCLAVAAVASTSCTGGGAAPGGSAPSRHPGSTPAIIPPTFLLDPSAQAQLPKCRFPRRIDFPEWFPKDLPLPPGSYATQLFPKSGPYLRVMLVIPGQIIDLARFVLSRWRSAGWVLGRGDAERGEVEDEFAKAPAVGAFKANFAYCDPGYSRMYIIYAPRGPLSGATLPPATASPTS